MRRVWLASMEQNTSSRRQMKSLFALGSREKERQITGCKAQQHFCQKKLTGAERSLYVPKPLSLPHASILGFSFAAILLFSWQMGLQVSVYALFVNRLQKLHSCYQSTLSWRTPEHPVRPLSVWTGHHSYQVFSMAFVTTRCLRGMKL